MRFGSVGGGGRYDGLVSRFRGEPVPATGFSIGVSRLRRRYADRQARHQARAGSGGGHGVRRRHRAVSEDWWRAAQAGIRAELYLGNPKHNLGQQMKYADRRGSPCAIVQGSNEREKGEVQIKDLILGATLTAIKDRDEYLKKQADAQITVPELELVEAVQAVLARHNVTLGLILRQAPRHSPRREIQS